mmetsp:Transcript_72290/g.127386  ORF Transcript_72290/g.127386 Transcript_72290/m.127386 type:complete len:99 (+) Transcript_72290:546-842(+)
MERHVVPANACVLEIVAVAKAERAKAVTRDTYSDEVVPEVPQSARHSSSGSKAAKACRSRHAGDADFEPQALRLNRVRCNSPPTNFFCVQACGLHALK